MIRTTVVGFPRIGEKRELKRALEKFWAGSIDLQGLESVSKELRTRHWHYQCEAGIDLISCNDFSLYDNMLDTAVMISAIPERFRYIEDPIECYFAMARGNDKCMAMEMTKWFNTNYHYIVAELSADDKYRIDISKINREYNEAKQIGKYVKINIIGPITFLSLSKTIDGDEDVFRFFDSIIEVYIELIKHISSLDERVFVQFEEPIFVKDTDGIHLQLLERAYNLLSTVADNVNIIVSTYFEHACEAVEVLSASPIWGVGLDFVYGMKNIEVVSKLQNKKILAGIVDGRNIWINDIYNSVSILNDIADKVGKDNVIVSTSCSLLHVPYTLKYEDRLDEEIKGWLSFALEKLREVNVIAKLFHGDKLSVEENEFVQANRNMIKTRKTSLRIHKPDVEQRVRNLTIRQRSDTFEERIKTQRQVLGYPILPTTTIGSFPQTDELRKLRKDFKKGNISLGEYEAGIKQYIDECISFQEEVGLDVLVHGEPERNDMVEYFGELLDGFVFTENGWVQSYGSRCVKPPIIYGDISRPHPMTIKWISYAQSRTDKIVKGMLTGPVTILNWSFVRDDIPRSEVAVQIAIALSDEVSDLQNNGIKIIQIDEAAFKEGYPLRKDNIPVYEQWAVDSFKIVTGVANKETQIHTHMCYSEFEDIIKTIEKMDADVISIETARSGNRLLKVFKEIGYKQQVGPGVYDIHSPRVPKLSELVAQIEALLEVLPAEQLWINPDCGLKTRKWEEVVPSLKNMVAAARQIREQLRN